MILILMTFNSIKRNTKVFSFTTSHTKSYRVQNLCIFSFIKEGYIKDHDGIKYLTLILVDKKYEKIINLNILRS